jgi:hypothetical protein
MVRALKRVKVIYGVRCDNCGAFFKDSGRAHSISDGWITSAQDAKYLRQGLRDNEFKHCTCGNPKPSLRKFKEIER